MPTGFSPVPPLVFSPTMFPATFRGAMHTRVQLDFIMRVVALQKPHSHPRVSFVVPGEAGSLSLSLSVSSDSHDLVNYGLQRCATI